MTEPGMAEICRLLGGIESKVDGVGEKVDRVDGKVDRVDEKVDGHAVLLGEFGVRLKQVEADQAATKAAAADNARLRTSNRVTLVCAAIGGACGVIGAVVTIIVH